MKIFLNLWIIIFGLEMKGYHFHTKTIECVKVRKQKEGFDENDRNLAP